jgi:hypothetical protein
MNNMQKIMIVIATIAIACVSCKNRTHGEAIDVDETITFSGDTEATIGSVVDSVTYLPLETNSTSIFSNADKMIIRDGRIYIGDYSTAIVVVFDMNGKHLFTIDRQGRGPGEYLRLSAFTLDDSYLYLMDNDSGMLRKYDLYGLFVEQHELPVLAWDIASFDDGHLLFATAPLDARGFISGQSRHRIFITDDKMKVHTSLFEYEEGEVDPIGKFNYLVENDEYITFHTMGSDIITIFSKADRTDVKRIFVDFGNRRIPDRYKSDIEEIDRQGYNYIQSTPVIAGNYISLDVNVGDFLETFLYNTTNHQLFGQRDGDAIIMPYPNGSSGEKYYVVMSGPAQYRALVADGFPKASPAVEHHIEQEGTTIMIYHMAI